MDEVRELGRALVVLGLGMLFWALAHWIDERFHHGGPDA